MRLLKATIENFLILERADVDLDRQGLVLVLGYNQDGGKADSNGVGKSSIFEAICWCLYGQTYKGLKHDDVISYASPGGTRVAVELQVGKDRIKVVRHRGHKTGNNKLNIYINSDNRTPFKQADAEVLLSSLLPLSLSAFKHVIYFGQKMGETFLSLNDAGRKQLLEELIGLDIFSRAEKRVKERLKVIKLEYSGLEGSRMAFKTSIQRYEQEIEQLDANRAKKLEEIQHLKKAHTLTGTEYRKALAEEREMQGILEDKLDVLNEQLSDANTALEDARKAWADARIRRGDAISRAELKQQELDAIQSLKKTCPTCLQQVDDAHKDDILETLQEELDEHKELVSAADAEEQEARAEIQEHKELVDLIKQKIKAVDDDTRVVVYQIQHLRGEIQKNTGIIADLARQENALAEPTEALQRALTATEAELAEVEAKLTTLSDELPYLEFWEKGFSATGVRSMVLDDVITYLNSRINHHSRAISDGEIAIELNSQTRLKSGEVRDKMSLVASTGGAGYIAASGGQQRRMDLAVHFALSDLTATVTGHKMNMLVCDEVLDCIDESGTDAILDMLEEKAEAGMSVFLISHSDSLTSRVKDALLVTRNCNVSTVERT